MILLADSVTRTSTTTTLNVPTTKTTTTLPTTTSLATSKYRAEIRGHKYLSIWSLEYVKYIFKLTVLL